MSETLTAFEKLFDSIGLLKDFCSKANLDFNIKGKNDLHVLRRTTKDFIKKNVEEATIQYNNFDGIGVSILTSLVTFFESQENINIIRKLQQLGLVFRIKEQVSKSEKLAGLSIIASGKLSNFSREDIKLVIEENGGKAVSSISSKTNFLLAGENIGPSKLKKATDLGISVITEDDFLKMIE